MSSQNFFISQIILVILDLLHFNNNFIISLSNSTKKLTGILFGLFACIDQYGDKLTLETKSEWFNGNSKSLVVAKECENKVDFGMYRVVCGVTSG